MRGAPVAWLKHGALGQPDRSFSLRPFCFTLPICISVLQLRVSITRQAARYRGVASTKDSLPEGASGREFDTASQSR